MTPRLPKPGEDQSEWGDILNDYLLVAHGDDGSLNADVIKTDHIQDGVVTQGKLDPFVQSSLAKANSALQPEALSAALVQSFSASYYAPEDYGCSTTANYTVNDAAIAAAIQDAIANNGIVQFTGKGEYSVSKAINQDVSSFVVRGNKTVLNVDVSFSGSYFWNMYSSSPYQYSRNQGTALSGITIQGAALGATPFAAAAIQVGHATYTNNSLFSIDTVYLQGFATGVKYIQNAWRVKLSNSRVTGGNAISVAPNLVNFGENMLVENCIFESYNPLVTIGTGEWSFRNCSFNNTLITLNGNCAVKLQGCHLEPHVVYPCISVNHPMALMTLDNTTLIIDPNVPISSAAFNVISTNITCGLIIRNFDTIQSANYNPQINNQNCVLVSGGGRVDIQGYSSNVNGYSYAISANNNLIYNGDAEKGTTVGWTTYASYGGSSTFTADNTTSKYGSWSLKLTTSGSSIYIGQAVPCRPGQWVFAQCWNKLNVSSGTGSSSIDLDFLSSKGDVIKSIGYVNMNATTDWTCRRQITGAAPVAPAGTASVRVYIAVLGSANTTAWYDDIIVNVA